MPLQIAFPEANFAFWMLGCVCVKVSTFEKDCGAISLGRLLLVHIKCHFQTKFVVERIDRQFQRGLQKILNSN